MKEFVLLLCLFGIAVNEAVQVTNSESYVDDEGEGRSWKFVTSNSFPVGSTDERGFTSKRLFASKFGFSIPVDATILGIEVRWERSGESPFSGNDPKDVEVLIWKDTSQQIQSPDDKAGDHSWRKGTSTEWSGWYGGPTDLWGFAGITPTEVNSNNFAVSIRGENDCNIGCTLQIEDVEARITYEAPPTTGTPTTGVPTTGVLTTGTPTTGIPTSGSQTESVSASSETLDSTSENFSKDDILSDSSDEISAVLVGAILGSIGATCCVALVLLGAFFAFRKKKTRQEEKTPYQSIALPTMTPQDSNQTIPSQSSYQPYSWEVPMTDLEFLQEIGRGSFGIVYLGRWRKQQVAIKRMAQRDNEYTPQQLEDFRKEIHLMTQLRPHKNVVALLGISNLCIITEYLPKGSLLNYLKVNKVDMKMVHKWAKDIVAGMIHLHAEGVVHRDLACRNLLLTERLDVKVSDFGLARVSTDDDNGSNVTQSTTGPLKWMAPECITSQRYSTKSDVWAWGITMIEIISRDIPYPGVPALNACIEVAHRGYRHPIPTGTPPAMSSLIQETFATEPKDRPTFTDIWDKLDGMQI